ncbi:MAG: sterol desaturase family protein [Deltaproteobacteria bacterium]
MNPLYLLLGLAFLGALFAVLEGLWPAEVGQRRLRAGLRTDLVYWFLTPLATRPLTGVAIALALVATALLAGTPLTTEAISRFLAPRGLVQALPRWAQAVAFFLLADLLGYLAHRLLHGRRLWPVHAVHHSSREVDWLSSVRAHPLNDLFTRSLQAVPLVLFGFDPALLVAWVPFLVFYSIFLHANVPWDFGPLRYVIATPAFHRWHHAETRREACNFAGLFPLWDLAFGTWHLPRGETPPAYGICNDDMPAGVLGQMAYPFRRRAAADSSVP